VLNPFDLMIQTDDYANPTFYFYRGSIKYELNQIQHLSMMRVPGNVYGLGPIQAAQKELLNARDTRDYASVWFESSGVPSGILKSDQMLSPDAAHSAKESWNALGAGGLVVLGSGLTYQPMYLNPKDSMFIESQSWNVQQNER
jgi:phage portal protein BeeE